MAKRYHASKKFARIAALHEEGAPAKAIRKFSDSWQHRGGRTTTGFHNSKAKSGLVTIMKGVRR